MRTEEEIMELYDEHEKLIHATIYRKYNNPTFLKMHSLTFDDLKQYGRIGLYRACQEFDSSKNTKFSSFAISNIIWSINVESKKDSLGNNGVKTFKLLDKTSLDTEFEVEEGEELSLHDIIPSDMTSYDVDVEDLIEQIEAKTTKRLGKILRLRVRGYTNKEIGEEINMSEQGVWYILSRNKNRIVELLQTV